MKMKKRIVAFVAVLAMALSMFTGCQGNKTETQAETSKPVTAEASKPVTTETNEPVTISWYRVAWHTNEDEKLVEQAINEYIEPLIGVNVKLLNDAENTDISLALAAGEDIDMWWDAAWKSMNSFIAGKSAYDLTDVIDNYPTLKASIPEVVWNSCLQNGKLWYVPVYKESGTGSGLTVPTAQVEKYGWDLSTVKELKDIEPMLKDLHDDGADAPYIIHTAYADFALRDTFASLAQSANQGVYAVIRRDDPTKVLNFLETPEYKEFLDLMHSWYENGYINEAEALQGMGEDTVVREKRNSGDNGFTGWLMVPDSKAQASNRYQMDTEVIPLSKNYADTDSAAGSVLMVNAKTEKLDAVMKFIELLNTDEHLANLATYGIEGKHYNLVDGKVELIPDSGYSYPGAWIVCNVTTQTLMTGESNDKAEQYDAFNNSLEISASNGFRFDRSKVEAELTALDGVFAEYLELVNRGVYDPDVYLPKFQNAAKNAGIDTVIAEIQSQWDAFLAEK